jgi:hypothetical protein
MVIPCEQYIFPFFAVPPRHSYWVSHRKACSRFCYWRTVRIKRFIPTSYFFGLPLGRITRIYIIVKRLNCYVQKTYRSHIFHRIAREPRVRSRRPSAISL